MDLVTPFIQPFLSYVWDPMVRRFGYLRNAKKNVDDMKSAMDDLKAVRDDVRTEIEAARRQQKQSTHEVERWLEKVQHIENEVAGIVNDYDQSGHCFYEEFSLNCWLNYKINRRAIEIHQKVVALHDKQINLKVAMLAPLVSIQEIPSSSNTEAMGSYLEMARSYLRDDTVGIVGIWGMGGVGKTTLLKAINNDICQQSNGIGEKKSFNHVIWVVASQELQIEKLQKGIAKQLNLSILEDADMMTSAMVIFNFLKDKDFLLLIDDLWQRIEFEDIGIPYASNKAIFGRHKWKAVFTTRYESVCGEMEAKKIKVECLKEEEAWALFQEKVGEEIIHFNPIIEDLAQKVANECCGLPLALIIIGRAMSTKTYPQQWEHALISLQMSHIKTFPGMEKTMYPQLKLSYDNLLDDRIRDCFLCCSLWPEDNEIQKKELIECWMGLDLIERHDDICETYNHGHFLIGALQEACLLEAGRREGCVRMHDVIRDLALWIVSGCGANKNRWMVGAGVRAREAPCEVEKWREVERVSFMYSDIAALPEQRFDCPNLSVLMLRESALEHIPSGFFKCMSSSLTYLDLSSTGIEELPKEVGCLGELKYLNLSRTDIKSLPEELGGLSKMKYFILNRLWPDVPSRVISGMSSLQELDAYPYSSVDTDWLDRTPGSLRAIGMRVDSIEALQKLRRLPTWDLCIRKLEGLVGSLQLQLLGQNKAHCLRMLFIWHCHNLEELEGGALPRLEFLRLEELRHLQGIIWKGVAPAQCLQSLNALVIRLCPMLKYITWILQLPSFADLTLDHCNSMEQVIDGEAIKLLKEEQTINLAFKKLRRLRLIDLPKLVSICVVPLPFPSLEYVQVRGCTQLRRLPFLPEMARYNKSLEISGTRTWWEALNWEDDSIKSSFQPYFKEVQHIENEVAGLVNDYDQRGCYFYEEFSLNCWLNYKINRRAIKIHQKVVALHDKQINLKVAILAPLVSIQEIPSSSNMEAIGSYLEMVRSYLRDDTNGIVGIWGMGGVGKTTLLKAIHNDICQQSNNKGEKKSFGHVIWVVASQELQIEKLQKDIAKHLNLSLPEDADMMTSAMVIFNFLKDKDFLLLIDDLWQRTEFEDIGIPYASNKTIFGRHKWKVVFTTRSEYVCGEMEAKKIKVECLKQEEAWALFQEKVGEGIIHSNPIIEDLAQKVANKCCGLPLALVIIGRAMSAKTNPQQWEHALTSLQKSHIKTFPGMEKTMYPQLKLSYDNLLDDKIRECFLCCSLWPEDNEIQKEKLIECWMGLGLIEGHDDICEAYNHGHFLIGALQEACLLEATHLEGCVRMHDVIRDLALWIASECGANKNRWMVRAGVGAREAPCEAEKWKEAKRVSLMHNVIQALPEEPFHCPNLTVLMLQSNYNLKHIPSGFLKCSPSSLTYLDLSDTGIEELPKEVGCLVELKYLNLSRTEIKSLPEELGGLSKIKYFLLNSVRTPFVASKVISGMSSLQVLDAYPYSSVDTDWLDRMPGSLRAIGMRVDSIGTLQKLPRLPTLGVNINRLKGLVGSLQLQLLGQNMAHCLRNLSISNCDDLEELEGVALPRLEFLCLVGLRHLRETIWKGVAPAQCLQSLSILRICECPKLKDVTWILQLPSLADLMLDECSGMEQVIDGEAIKLLKEEQTINLAFKKLKRLYLNDLPKLVSICVVPLPFPSLEEVNVRKCPELRRLPFLPEMARDNKSLQIWGTRTWWEALNWEDDSIKSSFQPYFEE